MMRPLCKTITDLQSEVSILRQKRFGVIEMVDRQLRGIHLRPWPKLVSRVEVYLHSRRRPRFHLQDRCLLFYNQPWGHRNFLALQYVVSSRDSTFATFRRALSVLDEIARIKKSHAIVTEVTNLHISDRLLNRWGWQRHLLQSPRRHFIKRFYGENRDSAHREQFLRTQTQKEEVLLGKPIGLPE